VKPSAVEHDCPRQEDEAVHNEVEDYAIEIEAEDARCALPVCLNKLAQLNGMLNMMV